MTTGVMNRLLIAMWTSAIGKRREPKSLLKAAATFSFALLLLHSLTGCATVKSKPKEGVNLTGYRKVIITPVDEDGDPRKAIPKVAERLAALGFEVHTPKAGEAIATQGTGLVVDTNGHVLTCAHVLSGKSNATVWIGAVRFDANVINVDTNKDVALLRLQHSTNTFRPLRFAAETDLSMGQDVFVMGFPLSDMLGSSPRLTKGLLSSTVGMGDDTNFVQISAEVQSGSSGGPLLNARGEVIGVVTSTLNPISALRAGATLPQNVNFAAKCGIVRDFLSRSGLTPRSATAGETATSFDKVKDSIALVRAGYIPADASQTKEMLCHVKYVYFWDVWYRFRAFQLDFIDFKTGDLLLRAGQYGDKVLTGEDAVIESVIAEVRRNFFPNSAAPGANAAKPPSSSQGEKRK